MTNSQKRIVVVGAGIGGLVLARAISKLGSPVTIVESAPALRALGAGITLGANAMRILDELDLGARVTERGRRIGGGAITDASGRCLSAATLDQLEARYGRAVAIERPALHEALASGIAAESGAPVEYRLGTSVARIEDADGAVTATLDSGERLGARAAIGADGIRSRVRSLTFGAAEPTYSGYTCWRWAGEVPGGIRDVVEMWGRGARAGLVPLGGERVYAFFVRNAERGTPGDRKRRQAGFVRERFAHFGGEVPKVLEAMGTDDTELLHHDIEEVVLPAWTKGRVALLGDAAHAMTPNLGQGAAMAIEDALVLARELHAYDDASAALRSYEARRRPRVEDIQKRSRSMGKVAQWQAPFGVWLRNLALSMAPASAAEKTVERLIAYVPYGEVHLR